MGADQSWHLLTHEIELFEGAVGRVSGLRALVRPDESEPMLLIGRVCSLVAVAVPQQWSGPGIPAREVVGLLQHVGLLLLGNAIAAIVGRGTVFSYPKLLCRVPIGGHDAADT